MSSAESVYEFHDDAVVSAAELHLVTTADATPEPLRPAPLTAVQAKLAEDNMDLVDGAVHWVRRRREGGSLDIEEAYGDGYFGLCDAALRFNPTYQVLFSTYAPHRIRGAIIDGERKRHKLTGPERKLATVVSLFNTTRAVSLDAPLKPGISFTLLDVLPADDTPVDSRAVERVDTMDFYAGLNLNQRQRAVAFLKAQRFSLKAIGDQLGISDRTVSRDFKAVVGAMFEAYYPLLPYEE
jgi:RNA polymerase sigma factor (sigma-70 family)